MADEQSSELTAERPETGTQGGGTQGQQPSTEPTSPDERTAGSDPREFERIKQNRDSIIKEKRELEKQLAAQRKHLEALELEKSEKAEDWQGAKKQLTSQYERQIEHIKNEWAKDQDRLKQYEAAEQQRVRTERFGKLTDAVVAKTGLRIPLVKGLLRVAEEQHDLDVAPESMSDDLVGATIDVLRKVDPDSFKAQPGHRPMPQPGLNMSTKPQNEIPQGSFLDQIAAKAAAAGGGYKPPG